jgi:hypothetical protein
LFARLDIILLVIVGLAGLHSIETIHKVFPTAIEDLATRVNGRVVSLQFADDGSASWLVSGRWRLDIIMTLMG